MKTFWHNAFVCLLMLLPAGLICCGTDTEDDEPNNPGVAITEPEPDPEPSQNALVGTWQCDSDYKNTFTFTSFGLMVYNDPDEYMDWSDSGTYEASKDSIWTITNNGYVYQNYTYKLSNDKLYIKPECIYGDLNFRAYSRMTGNNLISASSNEAYILGAWINTKYHDDKDEAGNLSYWQEETIRVFYANGTYREIYRTIGMHYDYEFIYDVMGIFKYDSERNRMTVDMPGKERDVYDCNIESDVMRLALVGEKIVYETISYERYSGRLH